MVVPPPIILGMIISVLSVGIIIRISSGIFLRFTARIVVVVVVGGGVIPSKLWRVLRRLDRGGRTRKLGRRRTGPVPDRGRDGELHAARRGPPGSSRNSTGSSSMRSWSCRRMRRRRRIVTRI